MRTSTAFLWWGSFWTADRSPVLSGDRMRVGAKTTDRFLASILLADFIICTLGREVGERG